MIFLAFALAFLFRLSFGVFAPPNRSYNDQQQTYLIGLKAYTTNAWPYFGPDTEETVNNATYQCQCPGALEGALIAASLKVWPDPLSPYLLLNLLSFGAFLFFGWYCHKRIPGLSPWFIYIWILFAPWDTHLSTQILNLSFGAVGSLLFFIGFMESTPALTGRVLGMEFANALMGFSFFWIMQFHLSWVLFVPLILVSFFCQWKKGRKISAPAFFLAGSLPTFAFLLPTYIRYGFLVASSPSGLFVPFNFDNLMMTFTTLARFLSLGSYEMPRWIGDHTKDRWAFLMSAPWLILPCLFLLVVGWAQALAMLFLWFKKDDKNKDWAPVKAVTAGVFLIIWLSFLFTARAPDAHRFYLTFPFVFYYFFHCWNLAGVRFWRGFGTVFIIAVLFFQAGYVIYYVQHPRSNYLLDREKIAKAIQAKDYHLLAERRAYSLY